MIQNCLCCDELPIKGWELVTENSKTEKKYEFNLYLDVGRFYKARTSNVFLNLTYSYCSYIYFGLKENDCQELTNSPLHQVYLCSKSAGCLLLGSHQADIRMRSHCLLRLDDNKSTASCQQAWCKLIVKTSYPQAWCTLFQQLAASLRISRCIKLIFTLDATWWSQLAWCNLLTNLHQAGKIHNIYICSD